MKRAPTRLVLASVLWSAAAVAQRDTVLDPVPATVRPSLDRAVRWLLNAQGRDGSWGDNPGSPGDIGNTCIAVMALLSTGDTLKRGPHARSIRRGVDWLLLEVGRTGKNLDYGDRFTLMQNKLGQNVDLYLSTLLFGHVIALDLDPGRAGGEEFLGAVFATHALHIEGDAHYRTWYPKICAMLVACQNQDGSWFGHHCITGRVFCTSCSIITFATPRKFLLMSER